MKWLRRARGLLRGGEMARSGRTKFVICFFSYRVDDMFVDDIATYVSLNWLEILKFPLDMIYPYWWTTLMQKMSPLSILKADKWALAQAVSKSGFAEKIAD
jgi:hypothetical protein